MTTNRVHAIDDALLARVHLSLHCPDLDATVRTRLWTAFLAKARGASAFGSQCDSSFTEVELMAIAESDMNGRQIKNAVRMAYALAEGAQESLGMKHIMMKSWTSRRALRLSYRRRKRRLAVPWWRRSGALNDGRTEEVYVLMKLNPV